MDAGPRTRDRISHPQLSVKHLAPRPPGLTDWAALPGEKASSPKLASEFEPLRRRLLLRLRREEEAWADRERGRLGGREGVGR
eukprot:1301900-Pleurochrysis_carterae.AAC.1